MTVMGERASRSGRRWLASISDSGQEGGVAVAWRVATAFALSFALSVGSGATLWAAAPQPDANSFTVDPVTDGALIGANAVFAALLEMIIATGELRPAMPRDTTSLLFFDRPFAEIGEVEESGAVLSNVFAGAAVAYGLLDTALRGVWSGNRDPWIYGVFYLESAAINLALGDLVKIAVRRPRPVAYSEFAMTGAVSDTNSALSFYSGHTALTAGIAATATYLAFSDGEGAVPGFITLGLGLVTTTIVAVQRVRARAHFPSDVLAGAVVGAAVGVLVPHLHRASRDGVPLSLSPWLDAEGGGGGLVFSGPF